MLSHRIVCLDLMEGLDPAVAQSPPTEFRIFKAGIIQTEKGSFTFDADSMRSVMEGVARRGVDIAIDFDHAMVNEGSSVEDRKAAGWIPLSGLVDRDGDLWATGVQWTECGAEGLSAREWRYLSPAFIVDKSKRVVDLVNVALTNIPATNGADPLVLHREADMIDLVKLTGADGPDNAHAVVLAWKASHDRLPGLESQLTEVSSELATLKSSIETREKADLIDSLSRDGKVTPAMRPVIEALSVAQIKAFGEVAPVVLHRETIAQPSQAANAASCDVFEGKAVGELAKSDDWALLHRLHKDNKVLFDAVMAARVG